MRRSFSSVSALVATAVLLIGCSSSTSAGPSPTAKASSSPVAVPSSDVDPQLTVTLDGLAFSDEAGTTTTASYDDPAALLTLLEEATGSLPEPEPVEDLPGYQLNLETYTWDGLRVTAGSTGEGSAWVTVTDSEVGSIPLTTEDGLKVGSTRAELLAEDAWAVLVSEDPATTSELGVGRREVPGTLSLSRPGSVGVQFLMFLVDGDAVTQLQAPANDFSDL